MLRAERRTAEAFDAGARAAAANRVGQRRARASRRRARTDHSRDVAGTARWGACGDERRYRRTCRRAARRADLRIESGTWKGDRPSPANSGSPMSSPEQRVGASSLRSVRAIARTRRLVWAAVVGALVVLLAIAAYAYDHSRRDLIAKGVRIDGIDVGGLHEAAARERLQRTLLSDLRRPITVRSGSRTWHLDTRELGLKVDVPELVGRAVSVSREGSIFSRTTRGLFGGSVDRNIS